MFRLARGLRTAPATSKALAEGDINTEHAYAIVDTLHTLPDDVAPETAGQVEAALLEQAQVIDAAGLRVLGARALAHAAPRSPTNSTARLWSGPNSVPCNAVAFTCPPTTPAGSPCGAAWTRRRRRSCGPPWIR